MHQFDDIEIIKDILNGDKERYRLLVEKYQQGIFRVCMGYVHDEDDANDLTQETFIRAYENLSGFQFNSIFHTWLYRIAINTSLNYLRGKRRNVFERFGEIIMNPGKELFSFNTTDNPEEILITDEQRKIIQKEIDSLSKKQRDALILSKYDDLSQKEIAEIMGITEGAVESLLQRAKTNLQKKLGSFLKK